MVYGLKTKLIFKSIKVGAKLYVEVATTTQAEINSDYKYLSPNKGIVGQHEPVVNE